MSCVPKHRNTVRQEIGCCQLSHFRWSSRRDDGTFWRTRICGGIWSRLGRQKSVYSDFLVNEIYFREDCAQVKVDVRWPRIVWGYWWKYQMLMFSMRLLLLLLSVNHLRVVTATLWRAAHVVALMNIVVFRLTLVLLLLMLGVDWHRRLQKVGVGHRRVSTAAGHCIFGTCWQKKHAVVEQRLTQTLLLVKAVWIGRTFTRTILDKQERILEISWCPLLMLTVVRSLLWWYWRWGKTWKKLVANQFRTKILFWMWIPK